MPTALADDGARLHYEEHGSGPLVVLVSYWSLHPSVFEPITAELAADHRVVRYDDRGSGKSTPSGPFDLDTAAADLAAVIAAVGGPAVAVCTADGANRAVRVAASRPELIEAIVVVGGAPLGRQAFAGLEVLSASDGVVEALLAQIETDYRGTLRGILTATNQQMSEDELRGRIQVQVEHVPREVAAERLRVWAADEPLAYSRAAQERIWVLTSENATGGWFPAGRQLGQIVERELPGANVIEVTDGMVSRPDETARVVRRILAGRAVPAD